MKESARRLIFKHLSSVCIKQNQLFFKFFRVLILLELFYDPGIRPVVLSIALDGP
jgi:hypothetical protein